MKNRNGVKTKFAYFAGLLGLGVAILVFVPLFLRPANAQSDCELFEKGSDNRKECEDIEKKERIYKEIIEIKEKTGESLSNQLSITNSSIQQVQNRIKESSQQIDDLNRQIIRLQQQIDEKDLLIRSQKKLLSNIVQSYYEVNQSGSLVAYLAYGNIASFMVKKDRIAQTGDKVKDLLDSIKETKNDLQARNGQLDGKKGEIVDANQKLKEQKTDLLSVKQQRQTLLTQTQGEEARYRQMLANIQKQKEELLDIDQYFAASGLSADSYPKPDSKYFASTGWFYYQWDPKWGNETIGNTKTKMRSYGCAVTAVSMVFKEGGVSMDPGKLANQPIFSGDLINWWDQYDWSKSWPVPDPAYGWRHGNISWSVVDSKIKSGIPVIVYIKKSNGGGGHYVVIHHKDAKGKYVVHDPYFGANIFLDTSRALIGAMGKSSSTSIDQMIIYR